MRPEHGSRNVRGRSRFRAAVAAAIAVASLAPFHPGPAGAADAVPTAATEPPETWAELLPAEHPAWEDVEALWNRGGLAGLPVFTRPLPRPDIAAALVATLRDRPDLATTGCARRLRRELAFELLALGSAPERPETAPPLEFVEEGARLRVRGETRLRATTTGDEGEIVPGTRGGAIARAYLPGGAFALADVWVEKIVASNPIGDAIVKGSDWYLSTEEAYLSLRTRPIDVVFGLAENRWGPGTSGTLLLSDATLSYPALQFATTIGRRARVTSLLASLHQPETAAPDLQPGPRLWFAAHRLEFGLGSRLRVGVHEAAAFRSDGPEVLYAVGVIPYTLVQRWLDRATADGASLEPNRNNVLVGIDAVWRVGCGIRLDGEFLIDDFATESASQPDRLGYQGGISWSGRLVGAPADARVEWVKVYRHTYAVFYDADFVHDRVPLGYGRGPDVEFGEAWIERDVGMDARIGCGVEMQRRGEGVPGVPWEPGSGGSRASGADLSGTVERSVYPHFRLRGTWRDIADLRLRLGALDVRNRGHVAGDDDTSLHLRAEARVEW